MNSPLKHSALGLEDLILTPEVSEAEVVAAADEMNKGHDEETLLIEQDQVIGKITDSGAIVMEVAERLETFARTAEAEIQNNNVTPQLVETFGRVTENELRRVEESPVTLSVENYGSVRVALESHVSTIREKIKALLEWFRKVLAAAYAAIKKYFKLFFDTLQRAQTKAKYYRKAALALKSGSLRDRSEPREASVSVNPKFLGLKDYDAHSIERGLALTESGIHTTASAVLDSARHATDVSVKAVDAFVANKAAEFDIGAALANAPAFSPKEQSGGAMIREETIGYRRYFAVDLPHAGKEMLSIPTPNPDQIAAFADRVIGITTKLGELETTHKAVDALVDKQTDALARAAKFGSENDVRIGGFEDLVKLCERNYGHDLEKIANYYIRVVLAANELCRQSLRAYPGHLPLVS